MLAVRTGTVVWCCRLRRMLHCNLRREIVGRFYRLRTVDDGRPRRRNITQTLGTARTFLSCIQTD
jgi:hypothetical protein